MLALAPALAGQDRPARSQAEIARALRSHDRDTVAHALAEVPLGYDPEDSLGWRFPPDYVVTPELSAALAAALEREAGMYMDGCTVTGIGRKHSELSLELAHYVVALRDPATIPALVQVVCSGMGVHQALMRFGPEIVPHLAAWARSPEAAWADVTGSLVALTEAVERWDETLSIEARASVKDVVKLILGSGVKRFVAHHRRSFALEDAMTLASVMRDPDLPAILAEIAEEDHEALDGLDPTTAANLRDFAKRGLVGEVRRW